MKKPALLVLGFVAAGLVAVAFYLQSRKTRAPGGGFSATGGAPINALPARRYSLGSPGLFSPAGQPPSPTFTPFSGLPVVEQVLRASQTPSSSDSSGQPQSLDSSIQNVDTSALTSDYLPNYGL